MAPLTPLRAPTAYFCRGDRPSLALAAGIVTAQALAVTVLVWLFMKRVIDRIGLSPSEASQIESALGGALVGVFVAVFVGWGLLAALVHVFMWFADAERGFGATLAVVGEAEIVGLVLLPVTAVGLYSLVGTIPADPQAAAEYMERATSSNTPLLVLTSFVGTVWKATIQGLGLATVHDIGPGKALALTFVLGFLGLLLNLV